MPFISVVVPTMRVGGIDLLFAGLKGQTFEDFELVLSDGLYEHRPDLAEFASFRFKHVEPRDNPFPLNAFCRYANEGLAHASGEIVLFLVDYTFLPPNLLQAHADFHKANDRRQGLMGPHQYYEMPALHPSFPRYGQAAIDRYCADLDCNVLDEVMYSLFDTPIRPSHEFKQLDQTGYANADPKLSMPTGPIGPSYLHAKNESVSLEAVLGVNGWDEDLDGTHCYQDSDLADRLAVKAGIQWHLDPSIVAQIVNPRRVFPFPRRVRPVEDNLRIWHEKQAAGYSAPVNTWSLR